MRHRGHRASDKRDNLARQANGRVAPCALIWLGTVERHCIGAWGCRSFCFPISPRSYEIRQPCLAEKRHRHLGTSGQERGRRDIAGSAACSINHSLTILRSTVAARFSHSYGSPWELRGLCRMTEIVAAAGVIFSISIFVVHALDPYRTR